MQLWKRAVLDLKKSVDSKHSPLTLGRRLSVPFYTLLVHHSVKHSSQVDLKANLFHLPKEIELPLSTLCFEQAQKL